MSCTLILKDTSGKEISFDKCYSFVYRKEVYTPYTYFSGVFYTSRRNMENVCEVKVKLYDTVVHHGLLDNFEIEWKGGSTFLKITSRGFTSLLCQNEIEPGLKPDMSISTLTEGFVSIPYVTYEENSQSVNYIYVKDGSSLWDGICNLSYKLTGNHPYIQGTNCIRMTPQTLKTKYISTSQLLSSGVCYDYTKMISHIHMQDVDGNYNKYNLANSIAADRNIVRHKQIPMDMQYLNDPENGLTYKLSYSNRGFYACWGEVNGYSGEELYDTLNIAGFVNLKSISFIEVRGSSGKIRTKYGVYYDGFNNVT